jgi:hypothetical protein
MTPKTHWALRRGLLKARAPRCVLQVFGARPCWHSCLLIFSNRKILLSPGGRGDAILSDTPGCDVAGGGDANSSTGRPVTWRAE